MLRRRTLYIGNVAFFSEQAIVRHAIDVFKLSVFYATTRLERPKEYFNHPADRVVLDGRANLFGVADGKARQ